MIHNSNIISIFCDGGSRGNPGPSACAFIVKDDMGKTIHHEGKFLGTATNNIAEYQGVLLALNYLKNNPQLVTRNSLTNFYLDSSLVVNQINGIFKVKNAALRELIFQTQSLISNLPASPAGGQSPISFAYVPREKNFEADLLVNQILDLRPR